ncbi:MAG: T9SS type A sorting domain-containing protein [Bacteroidota bacterium]
MKRLYILSLLAISLSSAFKGQSQSIVAQQTGYVSSWYVSLENYMEMMMGFPMPQYQEVGQTFKSSLTTTLTSIEFYISMFNYSGNVNIEIYSCSSQNSWGTLLSTKTNVPVNSIGWVTVDVSGLNVSVTAGNYYGFKLIPQYSLFAGIGAATDLYADGQAWAGGGFMGGNDYPFIVKGFSTLPVDLVSFTAQRQNNNVLLQWSTASEQNSKDFIIQHSTNGNTWANTGSLPAAGNSNDIRNYSYLHTDPVAGNNYYRILQTDLDGKFSYSKIRTVKFSDDHLAYSIVANPVINGQMQLQVNTPTTLSLFSSDGKLFWKKQFAPGMQTINSANYPRGVYLLKSNESTQRILLQ